MTLPPCFHTNS